MISISEDKEKHPRASRSPCSFLLDMSPIPLLRSPSAKKDVWTPRGAQHDDLSAFLLGGAGDPRTRGTCATYDGYE